MKKLLLGTVGVAVLGMLAPASAADMAARPYKAPPVPYVAPAPTWTGFYIGIEGGGGWGRESWSFAGPAGLTHSHNKDGGLFGGVLGFNYQAGQWVFGVEGMYNWADLKGSSPIVPGFSAGSDIDWLASVTGRLGYTWGSTLLYVKGGGAWTRSDEWTRNDILGTLNSAARIDRSGYTVGVGLEYLFAPNWSAKVEYNYYDFGSKTATLVDGAGLPVDVINSKFDIHTVKAGVNFHFNWGGAPVVANY